MASLNTGNANAPPNLVSVERRITHWDRKAYSDRSYDLQFFGEKVLSGVVDRSQTTRDHMHAVIVRLDVPAVRDGNIITGRVPDDLPEFCEIVKALSK